MLGNGTIRPVHGGAAGWLGHTHPLHDHDRQLLVLDEDLLTYLDENEELLVVVVKRMRDYTVALLDGSITPAALDEWWFFVATRHRNAYSDRASRVVTVRHPVGCELHIEGPDGPIGVSARKCMLSRQRGCK